MKFYWGAAMFTCWHVVCGCFRSVTAQLRSCDRGPVTRKCSPSGSLQKKFAGLHANSLQQQHRVWPAPPPPSFPSFTSPLSSSLLQSYKFSSFCFLNLSCPSPSLIKNLKFYYFSNCSFNNVCDLRIPVQSNTDGGGVATRTAEPVVLFLKLFIVL